VSSEPIESIAPGFTLRDQHGVTVALTPPPSGQATLLVFYPYAFSGICGGELQALSNSIAEFDNDRVRLLAISCDPMYALRAFADQEGFVFPLLSDFWPHGETARAYGVFDETKGCAGRGSFLIDARGVIRWSLINAMGQPRPISAYREAITLLD